MSYFSNPLMSSPEMAGGDREGRERDIVGARVNYVIPPLGRNKVYVVPFGAGAPERTAEYALTPVAIRDGRSLARPATLDGNGFALGRQRSKVRDFMDDEEVRAVYYPEMERLVCRATGGSAVLVFDHTVRIDSAAGAANSRVPVRIVHNDYTDASGPGRVEALLAEAPARARFRRRFAIVNVWRSIEGAVRTAPLGVIDAGSVRRSDLVPTDLVYPGRVGEIYEVAGNPAHRWHYFSRMAESEVLFIKGFDSRTDVARFTPHSAFDDPDAPAGAPPRKSIEIRSVVFY